MAWDDAKRAQVIAAYKEAKPTPENSLEIVAQLSDDYEEPPNGVRMVLIKAGEYIKKEATASKADPDKPKRVSKADSIADLKSAIEDANQSVEGEILDKLTGKAAIYFTGVIRGILDEDG